MEGWVLARLSTGRINFVRAYESWNVASRSELLFLSNSELPLPLANGSDNKRAHM